MVSPPARNCTSVQSTPASASAARAATTPYSTKLRPHLPHGCIPTPATTTSLTSTTPPATLERCRLRRRSRDAPRHRLPLVDEVVIVVVAEQLLDDELDLLTDG